MGDLIFGLRPGPLPALLAAWLIAAALGCKSNKPLDYGQPLPPGAKALRKITPDRYPDFAGMRTRPTDLARSIDNSLTYLARPSSQGFFPYLDITHDRAVATLRAMRQTLDAAQGGAIDWNGEIRRRFEVYQSVGAPSADDAGYSGQVLFTGYCTPIYDASPVRAGPFQWPLYKRPEDLPPDAGGDGLSARPYYTRAQIEGQNLLAGQELVWLKSRWEAYVVTIQGSARLRLPDGRIMEVGFAGTNGHPYVSPGRQMLVDGALGKNELSLTNLRRYFDAHPQAMDQYLWLNPRTVFFADRPGGPFGKLNVPVTPLATIATDKDVYPRAMPAFVETRVPFDGVIEQGAVRPSEAMAGIEPRESVAYRGFVLDQDAGGAIRAAGRCDLYMGIGPVAERIAGHQLYAGRLYYVALKPEFVAQHLAPVIDAAVRGNGSP